MNFENTYRGKRVLVTGHTGFKGSWLAHWLTQLDCEIAGLALDPQPNAEKLFRIVEPGLAEDHRQDIRDVKAVSEIVKSFRPDFIFHLAAQPLVIESYRDPLTTVSTNVLGTANLLEAIRSGAPEAHTVVITTDKCYENKECAHAYRETDALGGHDVYSASKAATEIITSAFGRSFFETAEIPGRLATARGGNVIGGGDFADNRIMPDIVRALATGKSIPVRNPEATRPWQHVLDCLSGYLALGAWLASDAADENDRPRAFNFGPSNDCERSVRDMIAEVLQSWPGTWDDKSDPAAHHEASQLSIAIDLADSVLDWRPVWSFSETVKRTVEWYQADSSTANDADLKLLMNSQISAFQTAALNESN